MVNGTIYQVLMEILERSSSTITSRVSQSRQLSLRSNRAWEESLMQFLNVGMRNHSLRCLATTTSLQGDMVRFKIVQTWMQGTRWQIGIDLMVWILRSQMGPLEVRFHRKSLNRVKRGCLDNWGKKPLFRWISNWKTLRIRLKIRSESSRTPRLRRPPRSNKTSRN